MAWIVKSKSHLLTEFRMFSAGLDVVREMERRGATIIADAKIRSAHLSTNHVAKLMGRIIREIIMA